MCLFRHGICKSARSGLITWRDIQTIERDQNISFIEVGAQMCREVSVG